MFSVADPDFGWNWEIQTPHRQDGSLIVNQPSMSRKVEVTVRGIWRLDGRYDLADAEGSVGSDSCGVYVSGRQERRGEVGEGRLGVWR